MLLLEALKGSLLPLAANSAAIGGKERDKTKPTETGNERKKKHNIGLFPNYLNPPMDAGGLALKERHQTGREDPDTGRPLSHYRQAGLCHKHTFLFSLLTECCIGKKGEKLKVAEKLLILIQKNVRLIIK